MFSIKSLGVLFHATCGGVVYFYISEAINSAFYNFLPVSDYFNSFMVTDGGYASKDNARAAQERGIINIVFNKITGSLKNIVRSRNIETRLKKWRSGIEAVISNLKRGFELFRCEWKTRARFDAKVYWNVIVYNIRVMTRAFLAKMQTQMQ